MDIKELNLSEEMEIKLLEKLNEGKNTSKGYRMYRTSAYLSPAFLVGMYTIMDKMGFHSESGFIKTCITKMIRQK